MSQVCLQFHNTKWIYNSVNELPSKTFCDLVKKVAAAIVAIFPILLALVIDVICDAYNYLSGNQKVESIAPKTHETQTVSQPQSSKYEGSQVFAYKINDQELRREFDYFNDKIIVKGSEQAATFSEFDKNWKQKVYFESFEDSQWVFSHYEGMINFKYKKDGKTHAQGGITCIGDLPWIQQTTIGLEPFVKSDDKERAFFTILRGLNGPNTVKFIAKKALIQDVQDQIKIEINVAPDWVFTYPIEPGTIYFDQTGLALRWNNPPESPGQRGAIC